MRLFRVDFQLAGDELREHPAEHRRLLLSDPHEVLLASGPLEGSVQRLLDLGRDWQVNRWLYGLASFRRRYVDDAALTLQTCDKAGRGM